MSQKKTVLEGRVPIDPENIEFWKGFAKKMVEESPSTFSDIIKVFLTAESAFCSIYLAVVSILAFSQNQLSWGDQMILFLPLLLGITCIFYSVISLLGNEFAFDFKKPDEVEKWYKQYIQSMRKKTAIIGILFISSIVLVPIVFFIYIF